MKVAIAATDGGVVFPGHFAHAPIFKIYEYAGGKLRLVEDRSNPLGSVPDYDLHGGGHHLHGVAKYSWLREKVLPDVNVVIAAGACRTSHTYFTSIGVKLLYVDPVEVASLVKYVEANPAEFEQALSES